MLIYLLDFFGRDIKDRTEAFLITRMQEQSMLELLYTNELMLTKVNQKLGDTLIASVEDYLNQMN